jgi:hypothetical protein
MGRSQARHLPDESGPVGLTRPLPRIARTNLWLTSAWAPRSFAHLAARIVEILIVRSALLASFKRGRGAKKSNKVSKSLIGV